MAAPFKPVCGYCGKTAQLVGGDTIYPRRDDLHHKKFWYCEPCKAWVGCKPNGSQPLGTLANQELRKFRIDAHKVFDPLWQATDSVFETRDDAYQWLAEQMGLAFQRTHFAMFNTHQCEQAISIVTKFIEEK